MKVYFVYVGEEDNSVALAFNDMEVLRDHLANLGISHGQLWSMSAVILLEEYKKSRVRSGSSNPTTPTTGSSTKAGKQKAGSVARFLRVND